MGPKINLYLIIQISLQDEVFKFAAMLCEEVRPFKKDTFSMAFGDGMYGTMMTVAAMLRLTSVMVTTS